MNESDRFRDIGILLLTGNDEHYKVLKDLKIKTSSP